jgi:hypothetical protein
MRRGIKAGVMHYQLNEKDLDGWLYTAGTDDIATAIAGGLRLITVDPATRREIINEPAMTWLRHAITVRAIDVLMIDPFSRLIRGNENAADVADLLMERLALLAVETEAAILIAQHTRKGGGGIATDGMDALRGSSAVPDGARNAYGLTKADATTMLQAAVTGADNLIMMTHLKGNLSRLEEPSYYRLVGVRLHGGNPATDPPQIERGRWAHTVERYTPVGITQSITDAMRNAVMATLDSQTIDKTGIPVPFGPPPTNGKGSRNPIPACAASLQGIVHGLRANHADPVAKEVIKDLITRGYVSALPVKLPSYKKDGSRNGSNDGTGLVCHWGATPWRRAGLATGTAQPTASAQSPATTSPQSTSPPELPPLSPPAPLSASSTLAHPTPTFPLATASPSAAAPPNAPATPAT